MGMSAKREAAAIKHVDAAFAAGTLSWDAAQELVHAFPRRWILDAYARDRTTRERLQAASLGPTGKIRPWTRVLRRKGTLQQVALAAPGAPLPAALAAPEPPAALAAPEPEAGPPVEIAALAALPSPSAGSGAGATAVQAALTRIGSPYVWGGGGPGAFDCSGLVQWAFAQAGVFLPHSSYALAAGGQSVSVDQMQPGDVVTQYSDASHVGIYVGDGLMVHASTYGIPVRVESVYNSPIYNVRRY
jgi:cell wall-associated NlpC family hydrolase